MRFRYPLETVLNVRRWARDSAMAEELNARRTMQESESRVHATERVVEDLQRRLRDWAGAGASLDLQRRQVLGLYLASSMAELETERAAMARAQGFHEQARLRLQQAAQGVRALERHREMKQKQHSRVMEIREYKSQDDLWMARTAARR
jgi:hypothetical protein